MTSPLVSRPPYGEARTKDAESGLPQGEPAGRGLPLDDGIPGTKTYVKPVEETGKAPPRDESIHRVDSPEGIQKDRSRIDVVDHSDGDTSFNGLGEPEGGSKTKYPYRDKIPNAHNASEFVAGLWRLETAPSQIIGSTRVAATIGQMLTGLNPDFLDRSRTCAVTLKRADVPNLRWIFEVNAGNGAKAVRVKATRSKGVTQFGKLDLHVACSCPAWRWQGPEYHSTTKGFQDPKTPLQGTASSPDIRDPQRQNFVCKHVAAVLEFTKDWVIPKK